MPSRLASALLVALLVASTAAAKDKDKKKLLVAADILGARTAVVVIDPEAGEPLDKPSANANARTAVEKALLEWGRFDLIADGQESDLIFLVRTGNGKAMRPTIKGGPIDQRPGYGESTDSTIRIGGHHGQAPPLDGGQNVPDPNRGPHISNEVGPSEDIFEVYRGNVANPLDSTPVWRYIAKDCLREPRVAAVEEFRKAIADAEKPQVPKKP
jgi:hypothetical protein